MLGDSFNKSRRDQTTHSWELCREAQRVYRKEVHKASKETWRAFCTSINELPRVARLHRALSKDPKVRLGSLVAPSGERTQSEEETPTSS
jgi:Ni,Fe-hydrogenase I large subunit